MDIKRVDLEIRCGEKSDGLIYFYNENGKIKLCFNDFEIDVFEWEELSTAVSDLILVMKKVRIDTNI